MSNDEQKLDSLDFSEENGENIYQQSLADSQEENIAKDDVLDINTIAVDGADSSEFEARTDDFDRHFRAFYAGQDYGFEYFKPAYQFGFETAMTNNYTGNDWSEQESGLADTWNDTNPDTWDTVKDAVKHGWNKALDAMDTETS